MLHLKQTQQTIRQRAGQYSTPFLAIEEEEHLTGAIFYVRHFFIKPTT